MNVPNTVGNDVYMTATAKFNVGAPDGTTLLVKGDGSGNFGFAQASGIVQNGILTVSLTSTDPVPTVIDKRNFTANWKISFDGGTTWNDAGSTTNKLYTTNIALTKPVVYTVLDIGCRTAIGKTISADVLNAIWNGTSSSNPGFSNVFNSNLTGVKTSDGTNMQYWGSVKPPNTYAGLIKYHQGRCEAWADLLIAVMAVQGISSTHALITPNFSTAPATYPDDDSLYWTPSIDTENSRGGGFIVSTSHGQGNANAPTPFKNHSVVLIGTSIFDPSYGTVFAGSSVVQSEILWEAPSIQKFIYDYGPYNAAGAPKAQDLQNNNDGIKECGFAYGGFSYVA
jgi:hypothetical protein